MLAPAASPIGKLQRKTVSGWLAVGFALGGFFDGIVLHQVLQWHHLLSGLDDPAGSDLRFQMTADGLFHVFMYVVAVAGAVLLVANRASGARGGTTSEILRLALLGFGSWHVVDAVFSHWLLGIHRIRMDSEVPLVWDVAWLVVFGILPIVLALVLPNRGGPSRGVAAALSSIALIAAALSAAGPRFAAQPDTIVVFRPGMDEQAMMQAVLAAGATLKWTDASRTVWAVDEPSWVGLATLYARGALVVGNVPAVAGCLAWTMRPQTI